MGQQLCFPCACNVDDEIPDLAASYCCPWHLTRCAVFPKEAQSATVQALPIFAVARGRQGPFGYIGLCRHSALSIMLRHSLLP